jgi:hypothetical protein
MRLPLLIEGFKLSTSAAYQAPWRLRSGQGNDPRALQLREAWLAPGSGTISEPIYPFGVEAMKASAHGLGVAAEFLGYFGGAKALPAQRDDSGSENQIARSVTAVGEHTDLALLFGIFGWAGAQQLRHDLFSFSILGGSATRLCIPLLRNGALATFRCPHFERIGAERPIQSDSNGFHEKASFVKPNVATLTVLEEP